MEYWMASVAVDEGRNSFTATSLFSFFLSKIVSRKTFCFLMLHANNL